MSAPSVGGVPRRRTLRQVLSGRHAIVVLAFAIALLLVLLSAPRVIAEGIVLPERGVLLRLERGALLPPDAQAGLERALRTALRVDASNPDYWAALGRLERAKALQEGVATTPGRQRLADAARAFQRSLALRPVDSEVWALLAEARFLDGGAMTRQSLAALEMSYGTGRYGLRAMPLRLNLAFAAWEKLDDNLRSGVLSDLRYRWSRSWDDQKAIIRLVCRYNRALLLAEAVREDAKGRAEFDRLYAPFLSPQGCRERPV